MNEYQVVQQWMKMIATTMLDVILWWDHPPLDQVWRSQYYYTTTVFDRFKTSTTQVYNKLSHVLPTTSPTLLYYEYDVNARMQNANSWVSRFFLVQNVVWTTNQNSLGIQDDRIMQFRSLTAG